MPVVKRLFYIQNLFYHLLLAQNRHLSGVNCFNY